MPQKQHIADLINLGVEFFVHNRKDEADIVFDGAMHALIKIMKIEHCCSSEVESSKLCEANQLLLDYRTSTPNEQHQSCVPRLSVVVATDNRSRSPAQNDPCMFCKAFSVAIPFDEDDSPLTTDEMSVLAGILMFNRALSRHLKASSDMMATPFEIYQTRIQAAMLYAFCYDATAPLIHQSSTDKTAVLAQLGMASLNNLALLLQERGEYDQARHYLWHLEDLVRYCNHSVPDEEFSCQRSEFLLNVRFLLESPTTAACA